MGTQIENVDGTAEILDLLFDNSDGIISADSTQSVSQMDGTVREQQHNSSTMPGMPVLTLVCFNCFVNAYKYGHS